MQKFLCHDERIRNSFLGGEQLATKCTCDTGHLMGGWIRHIPGQDEGHSKDSRGGRINVIPIFFGKLHIYYLKNFSIVLYYYYYPLDSIECGRTGMSRRENETRPGGGFLVNFLKCLIDPSPEILHTLIYGYKPFKSCYSVSGKASIKNVFKRASPV